NGNVDRRDLWFREWSLPTEFVNQDAPLSEHVVMVLRDDGCQCECTTPTGGDGNVLFAVHGVRNRRSDDSGMNRRVPQQFACVGGIRREIAVGAALEHEIAGGGQQAAVPRRRVFDAPYFLLLDRIPRGQITLDLAQRIDLPLYSFGRHAEIHVDAEI